MPDMLVTKGLPMLSSFAKIKQIDVITSKNIPFIIKGRYKFLCLFIVDFAKDLYKDFFISISFVT